MKKTITILSLAFSLGNLNAQTIVTDFETFTLSPNSAYNPMSSTPFQSTNVEFEHTYNSSWGFWDGGFSYTNVKDSSTTGFSNEYGVRAYSGYTNSTNFVVGLDESVIRLTASQTTVSGFYVTNTTYAYKSMASGDQFSRKFGDTTGTGSGTSIAQGSYPDYFKLVIKGYQNGLLKNDSVSYLLADFTFTNNTQDYILDTWQYVNTSTLGAVDSVQFFLRSSDVGEFGINTPLYFAIDNFETISPLTLGIGTYIEKNEVIVYPNPFQSSFTCVLNAHSEITLKDIYGNEVYKTEGENEKITLDLLELPRGIYLLEVVQGSLLQMKKLIKN